MNTYLTHRIHGTSPVYLPTNLPSISAIHVGKYISPMDPMEYLPACGDFVVGLRMAYHSQALSKNEHAKPRISNAKKANITKPTSISLKSEIYIHSQTLTWNLKISPWKRRLLLETIIFRFHVKLWGCNLHFLPQFPCSRYFIKKKQKTKT